MLNTLKQQATFVKQFGTRFETTGSLMPSSRFVAKAITRFVQQRGKDSIRILECGPGTGPFSDRIVRLLQPGDAYHLVELNEIFVAVLRQRFAEEQHWMRVKEMTEIFALPLQDFNPDEKYDFIISGLPHINFPTQVVEEITASYFKLLKPGGMLSYFEYMYVRPIRKMVTLGNNRRRIREVNAIMEGHIGRHRVRRDSILINVPPVWVQHLRMDTTA
jgi:phosphatidylethanolamine/phosphatidyl-N-methylethanolamine N-methyltransferase